MGIGTDRDRGWRSFLERLARTPSEVGAYVARNFLLEEGAVEARIDSYHELGGAVPHPSLKEWQSRHEAYLTARVFCEPAGDRLPTLLDPADEISCPETFRFLDHASPFLATEPRIHLIRVETVSFVARRSGYSVDEVRAAAEDALGSGSREARRRLNDVLESWTQKIQMRPMYSAFLADVVDLFGNTPSNDPDGWADKLRDRLGLTHHDPKGRSGPIDILLFRYPVSAVPKLKVLAQSNRNRPLLPPTVLDGRHSPAFFPAPRGSLTGHAVDLAAETSTLFREVVHPTVAFQAKHLWRLGTIRREVRWDSLPLARGLHLLLIRKASGRADYAVETDQDLLTP